MDDRMYSFQLLDKGYRITHHFHHPFRSFIEKNFNSIGIISIPGDLFLLEANNATLISVEVKGNDKELTVLQ